MYRIFLVEDDEVIAKQAAKQLSSWGYEVITATDFSAVDAQFVAADPQLVILDIMLPYYNGHHWCSEIRKISRVPILFLSSASDNMNIVMAMNMGGDDFLSKPFDIAVLVAKVRALLRRAYDFGAPAALLDCGGAALNVADATLRRGDAAVELSRNECRILQLLLENKGHTVSRSTLMTRLWESDSYVDENTLTVNMTRLRKKLEQVGVADLIHTKKGEGYLVE